MEGNHNQPPARRQQTLCRLEGARQLAKLVIDENAQSLEDAGGGVNLQMFSANCAGNNFCQTLGRLDRSLAAGLNDEFRRPARTPLLTVNIKYICQIGFAQTIDRIGGTGPVLRHAHIQRPGLGKGKATLGLVDLHRGHADIEHDTVNPLTTGIIGSLLELGERTGVKEEALTELGGKGVDTNLNGRVPVDRDEIDSGRLQNGATITAGAEGAVDNAITLGEIEGFKHFAQQNGDMAHAAPPGRAPGRSERLLSRA